MSGHVGYITGLASLYTDLKRRADFYDRIGRECLRRAEDLRKIVVEPSTDSPPKRDSK